MNSSPPQRATLSVKRVLRAQRIGDAAHYGVASRVTEAIVHGLEVVEVEEHDAELAVQTSNPRLLTCERVRRSASITESGEDPSALVGYARP